MPKPIFEDNGSGMHTHSRSGRTALRCSPGTGTSDCPRWRCTRIGGVLKHARALLAFAAPTTNSYRRLVPGFEAPINLAMSARNRSAAVRIPMYSDSPKAKRFEFRCPDPSCNGYLLFSALLMAVLDGIENEIDPGEPLDRDIYEMTPEELAQTQKTPGTLEEALEALEEDHEFLTRGGVFTDDSDSDLDRLQARERAQADVRFGRIPTSSSCTTTTDSNTHSERRADGRSGPGSAAPRGGPFF